MKFVFIIPSLHTGGMERVMSILLCQFKHLVPNAELHLVLFGIEPSIFYQIPETVIIHRPIFRFDNRRRTWHTLKTVLFLRNKLTSLNADAMLSFGERWNNIVLLSGLGRNWPIFVSDRCRPDLSLGRFQNLLRVWLYPKAKGVIAQTSQAKEIFLEMYCQSNMPVIGNPIKKVKFTTFERREKIILNVGRIIGTKHQAELIDIFLKISLTKKLNFNLY